MAQSRKAGKNFNLESEIEGMPDSIMLRDANILITSSSGGGKSVLIKALIESLKNYLKQKGSDAVVIYVNDPRKNFEHLYCIGVPSRKYHLDSIRMRGGIPSQQPVKIWTPFSSKIPKKLIPEQNFFTIPIGFSHNCLKLLIEPKESREEGISHEMSVCESIQENLGKNETLMDFKVKIDRDENISDKIKKGIRLAIGSLEKDMPITSSSDRRNLDIRKILEDPDHYHFLNLNYMENKKQELFIKQWFIDEILKRRNKAKYKIILVYSEMVKDAPLQATRSNKIFAEAMKESLFTFRGAGFFITDCQVFTLFQESLRNAFNTQMYGFIDSAEDKKKLADWNNYDAETRKLLFSLRATEFIVKGIEDEGVGRCKMPSHRIWEEGETTDTFMSLCRQYHGVNKYTQKIDEHQKFINKEQKKWGSHLAKKKKKEEQKEGQKENKEAMRYKRKLQEMQSMKDARKKEEKADRDSKILALRGNINEKTGKNYSLREIAGIVGCSTDTVRNVISKAQNV